MSEAGRRDFFVSYTAKDRQWAEWIAWELEAAGFTVFFQDWDFLPGVDFVAKMDEASAKSDRVIAVLSPNYLGSLFAQAEWRPAFAADPTGAKRSLMLVRIAPCEVRGLLKTRVYCDLVGRDEESARAELRRALADRGKPGVQAPFPPRQLPPADPGGLAVERITEFNDATRDVIHEAVVLYRDRIPGDEQYDVADMVELIRRHLSDEFGPDWRMYFLVARSGGRVVGLLICYDDLKANMIFVSYLAAHRPGGGWHASQEVSKLLLRGMVNACLQDNRTRRLRFIFEVDDPALIPDAKKRRQRLARMKLFETLAPIEREGLRVRALKIPFVQPALCWPPRPEPPKQLLLCYAADDLPNVLSRAEVVNILTWTYTQLYGPDIFEDPEESSAYGKHTRELLAAIIRDLPDAVPLVSFGEIERAVGPS